MKKKLLIISFRHETNVFCPRHADEQAFRNNRFLIGAEALDKQRGTGAEIGAFLEVFDKRDDVELIPTVSLYASPCGRVSADVYDFVVKNVVDTIEKNKPIDGVLIDFHGAMVSECHPDSEGDLLEIIREKLGFDLPIVTALDLHANVTEKMARCADAMIPYEEYPHTDIYETGLVAAKIMEDTIDGKFTPTMAYRRIPFLLPLFPSDAPEMKKLYDLARRLREEYGARSVRFAHGFFASDIEEMGVSVMVVTDGNRELAEKIAHELAQAIENEIPNLKREYISLDDALDIALCETGPVAIGDASDNPGAGALGDTTHILRRILERGITGAVVATILDPVSAEICAKAGVGETVELNLGGWSDPDYSGGPLKVTAHIRMISDGKYINKGKMLHAVEVNHGTTAVVEIEGNIVLITSLPRQPLDLEIFRRHGIAPEEQKILVAKSTIHYRASFGTVASQMITVALRGYSSPLPQNYSYKFWKGKV